MIDGPHIFGFSPVAFCINLISTLASARLVGSVRASINAATFCLVGLVLFSAISAAFHLFLRLPQRRGDRVSHAAGLRYCDLYTPARRISGSALSRMRRASSYGSAC